MNFLDFFMNPQLQPLQPFVHSNPLNLVSSFSTQMDKDLYFLFQVQHIHFLSEHIGGLFLNDEYSDVTLMVENQVLSAHKVILAARQASVSSCKILI